MSGAVAAGAFVALVGGFFLSLWLSGTMTYRGLSAYTPKTNASLCLVLCGVGLALAVPRHRGKVTRAVAQALALLAVVIGALTLVEHLFAVDLGIDQLIATEKAGALGVLFPNRMGPPGSVAFAVCGVGILLLLRDRGEGRLVQSLGILLCLIALPGILGYLYQAERFYDVPRLTGVAFPVAGCIFLLGVALLCARPRQAIMATFTSHSPGGVATRRLLLPAIVLPILLGWLRLKGELSGLYGVTFGTSILVLSIMIIFSALVYQIGKRLEVQEKAAADQRTLQAIREGEQRLHTVIDNLTDGVILIDPASGTLQWNRRALIKHRYDGESSDLTSREALRLNYETRTRDGHVLPFEWWPVNRVLQGEEFHDLDLVVRDKTRNWERIFSYGGKMVHDAAGRPQMGVLSFRDITVRVRAEEAVREREALLRVILETLPVAVWVLDAVGTVQHANKAAKEIWGETPLVGMEQYDMYKAWWADTGERVTPEEWGGARAIRKGESSLNEEMEIETFDGSRRTVLVSSVPIRNDKGDITGAVAINQDITVRKLADERLRQSEEKFRAVFQQAAVGMGRVTFDEARWVDVNDAFCRMLGYSRDEMLATPWPQMTHPEDLDLDLIPFKEMAAGTLENYSVEKRFFHKEGHTVWARLTLSLVRDLHGRPAYEIAIVEDVTDRKDAEEALNRAKEELELRVRERTRELEEAYAALQHATDERLAAVEDLREKEQLLVQQSRMAAMGQMLANIAHQWRQPLNILSLLIQELEITYDMGEFGGDFLKREVSKGMEVINHMSQTINDFMDFLKAEKEAQPFSLNKAVVATLALLETPLMRMKVAVEIDQADELVVNGHRNEFSHVIMNLVNNARDAFRERGTTAPTIVISLAKEGDRAVVTVADNAGGIPKEILPRVFDAYFTTKAPESGTGIGLYMSKKIVEGMGGALTVRNTAEGAQFRMEFSKPE